ncbi:NeuD/PglB/VioB family sugar acetyltransferase [Stutzerimonas nitrititolerans]|uniref:NeuD/PglB/VioB family sugar acetyltransferase n=1 Tax=Stutzerimonas nitrititolerans TaxID=2482751 RepID=UPI0028AD79A4|nr:NeuD/PglB/VioB family sugar acetyltransferase [Stutzerimonas nitrititolerans]
MKKTKLLLIGGGGHCNSVIDVIEQENRFQIVGIIDNPENLGKQVLGYPVIATDNQLAELYSKYQHAIVTVGQIKSSALRVRLYQQLKEIGYQLPVIISPMAYVSKHAQIGEGTVILHHALVNASANIGNNCIINSKALIEHDAHIHDHCHIATASVINGGVVVEANTFVGSNTTSVQGCRLHGFIKAGALAK